MPIKTQSAKSKGRRLQQYVQELITNVFKFEEGDVVSRPMGSGGVDLLLSPHARRSYPFSVECKNTKALTAVSALKQSKANAYPDTLPALVWHPKGASFDDSIIMFNIKDFTEFWRDYVLKTQ